MNLEALSISIFGPALLAGLLVLCTHIPLGMQVLRRGIVFIDLAVAQVAALGLLAAGLSGWEPQGWQVQVVATGSALLAALLLIWMEKRWPEVQEAMIGAMFVLAASAALILLAHNPHGGEHLQELLAGQILWVTWADLIPLALISVAMLAIWRGLSGQVGRSGFYLLFAIAVTASVQQVGIYLVFSSLILPALAVRHWSRNNTAGAFSIGILGYGCGLVLSALLDLPSGPVIVWSLALLGLAANLLRRYD